MDKTLGLCIISCQSDLRDLDRCLQSVSKSGLVDDIYITDTSQSPSDAIKLICKNHGAQYSYKQFMDNFAEVRNYNFAQSNNDYIMWLDSDDVINPDQLQRLIAIKPKLSEYAVWIMDYVYCSDAQGKPILTLPRERIVKNCPEIKWIEPVHECLTISSSKCTRIDISITHKRSRSGSSDRNLKILKPQYDNGTISERSKFYYGKELFYLCKHGEAVPILEDYLVTGPGKDYADNLTIAAFKLGQYYAGTGQHNKSKIKAFTAIKHNNKYAEPYVLLGQLYGNEGKIDTAIGYYKEALTKKLDGGMSQMVDYYKYIPARNLCIIYNDQKDFGQSMLYGEMALSCKQDQDIQKIVDGLRSNAEIIPVFMCPGPLDPSNGPFRIRRYNLHNQIPKSRIIDNYHTKPLNDVISQIYGANIAVFCNFCQVDYILIKMLQGLGIKCIMDECEFISGYPWQTETMSQCDAIICCSTRLAHERVKQGYKTVGVSPDAFEATIIEPSYDRKNPKALYIGQGGNQFLADSYLRKTVIDAGYDLVICSEWDSADIKWTLDTWRQTMMQCDVILCPQRVDVQPAKSNVKATQAMSMGLPVIASPLQAYMEVIEHGVNGYIATALEDWSTALIALKDPTTRKRIGEAGKKSVQSYSIESVTSNWINLMQRLVAKGSTVEPSKEVSTVDPPKQTIDIIIPNYNNWDYLRMCLDSILVNTLIPYRIIISDAGSDADTWTHLRALKGIVVLGDPETRLSFSEACNKGISQSNSKYFVILNSDVIVSKGWLTNIVKKMDTVDRLGSCGVLSNCDAGWLHNAPSRPSFNMRVNNNLLLQPGMKINDIKPHVDDLYKFMEGSNVEHKDKFVNQEWVAAYATCYARCAIDEVGLFDTRYKNGCEDLDLGNRLNAFGYKCGQAIDSFVYHFGGVSRYHLQNENKEQYDVEDKTNHLLYKDKWKMKKIAIYTGPAWEPWDASTVEAGMAGSETWATYIARAFMRSGYRVTIYGHLQDPNKIVMDGLVRYVDHRAMLQDLQYDLVDLFISSRTVEPLKLPIHSKKNMVMIHDIWLSPDPNYDLQLWRVDKFLYLSDWHKEFLQKHHKIPDQKLQKTSNGVLPYYQNVSDTCKRNQAVYSSSPDRGLYQLLQMVPEIRAAVPDFELIVCYGFFNWESAARNDKASLALIDKIKELMKQPGVIYKGRVSKQLLSRYEMESKIWLYPTWFTETQCITAYSARHAQCAIVTTALGGLLDTVGDAGILLSPDGLTRDGDVPIAFKDQFVLEAVKLLTDDHYRMMWVDKGSKELGRFNWDTIAEALC